MSTFEDLKASFKRRLLTAAHEHLFGHLETTLSGYEKELDRRRNLLQMITNPDLQQMLATKEEVPGHQRSSGLDQDEPEPSNIKEQEMDNKVLMEREGSEPDFYNKVLDFSESGSGDSDEDQRKSEERFCCSECGKGFKQRAGLKIHMRSHTGEKPYSCSVCGKCFAQSISLRYHLKIHAGEKPFSCSVCGRSFRQKGTLTMHMLTHTGERGFGCLMTENSSQLSEIRKKPQTCSECGETFSNKYLLVTHMRMHKGKKLFTCTVCGVQRQFRSQLDIHMRRHTGERPYSCSICGKTFTQRGIMMQHMAVHSGVKPYSCSKCGRRFYWHFQIKKHKCDGAPVRYRTVFNETECSRSQPVRELVLSKHLKQDHRRKTSAETDDSADIEFWKDIRQHQSGFTYQRKKKTSVTDTEKKPFSCSEDETKAETKRDENGRQSRQLRNEDVSVSDAGSDVNKKLKLSSECHKGSEERHSLQTHNRYQTGEKPFSCFFCGKGFVSGGSLTRHISFHTGEKLLRCVICEKRFALLSQLKSHKCVGEFSQLHQSQMEEQISANKLFSCSQCGKRFGLKHQLQVHMRIHRAGNRFSCSVCGKMFNKRQSLSSHMTCHTEEDSICCSVCNAGFSDKESLIQHMRIHTRQTQFSCSICGKEFAWRRNLTKHMDVHAKETVGSREGEFVMSSSTEQTETDQSDDGEFWKETRQRPSDSTSTVNKVCDTRGKTDKTSESLNPQSGDSVDAEFWKDRRQHPSDSDVCDTDRKQLSSSDCHQVFHSGFLLEIHRTLHPGDTTCTQQFTQSLSQHLVDHTGAQRGVKQEPEPPHIKEEQEELWSGQEGEQLEGLEEFPFSPVPVKTEDDEEKPQSSQLHQSQTENNRDSDRGSEPHRTSGPERCLGQNSDCSEPESDDSDFWKETKQHRSGSNSVTNSKTSQSGLGCDSDQKPLKWSDDKAPESLHPESDDSVDSDFWKETRKPQLELNSPMSDDVSESEVRHGEKKPFSCSECGKQFLYIFHLNTHKKSHKEEKPLFCAVCGQKCLYKSHLKIHMRTHTGEKPFRCPVCGKKYAHKASMQSHMMVHTLNNRYSCSLCDKSFGWYTELKYHQCVAESPHDSEPSVSVRRRK